MSKTEQLQAYVVRIARVDPTDDAEFHSVIRSGFDLMVVNDEEIAHKLNVSRTTVNRWRNAKSAPHPAVRPIVYAFLKRRANKELEIELRDDEESSARISIQPPIDVMAAKAH